MEKQNEGVEVQEDGNDNLLRKTDAALFTWPWKNLGNYKACFFYYYMFINLEMRVCC